MITLIIFVSQKSCEIRLIASLHVQKIDTHTYIVHVHVVVTCHPSRAQCIEYVTIIMGKQALQWHHHPTCMCVRVSVTIAIQISCLVYTVILHCH